MKRSLYILALAATSIAFIFASCKKDKKTESPSEPPAPTPTPQEVITTLRLYIWDSISNAAAIGSPFTFKDPDGDGGQPGAFLNNGADSLIGLTAGRTYRTKLVLLDETKSPVDSISGAIAGEESYEHLFFYNGNPSNSGNNNGNTVLKASYPNYMVKLNGSNITLRYTDVDNGASKGKTTRNIGLETILKTPAAAISGSYPLIVTLRHQPDGAKDGTYAPGETDIEVMFKVKVN